MKENDLIVGQPYLVGSGIYFYKGLYKDNEYLFVTDINDLNTNYSNTSVNVDYINAIALLPNYDYSKEKEITIKIKESDLEELERHNIKYKEL